MSNLGFQLYHSISNRTDCLRLIVIIPMFLLYFYFLISFCFTLYFFTLWLCLVCSGPVTSLCASPSSPSTMGYGLASLPPSGKTSVGWVGMPQMAGALSRHYFLLYFSFYALSGLQKLTSSPTHFWREPFSIGPFHLHCVFLLSSHFH